MLLCFYMHTGKIAKSPINWSRSVWIFSTQKRWLLRLCPRPLWEELTSLPICPSWSGGVLSLSLPRGHLVLWPLHFILPTYTTPLVWLQGCCRWAIRCTSSLPKWFEITFNAHKLTWKVIATKSRLQYLWNN